MDEAVLCVNRQAGRRQKKPMQIYDFGERVRAGDVDNEAPAPFLADTEELSTTQNSGTTGSEKMQPARDALDDMCYHVFPLEACVASLRL